MMQRAFFSAFAAILLSATMIQTAEAVVLPARSGTTTVTGAYRPLNLDLTLVESFDGNSSEFIYDPDTDEGSVTAYFTGSYTTSGYPLPLTGIAGNWVYQLDFAGPFVDNELLLFFGASFGTFDFLGGGNFTGVPYEDTPQAGDRFLFGISTTTDAVMRITSDGEDFFELNLLQPLQHLGPFIPLVGGSYVLDDGTVDTRENRVNQECFDENGDLQPCGSVFPLTVSSVSSSVSVPEPATLALLGLGLAGLGLSRRTRA